MFLRRWTLPRLSCALVPDHPRASNMMNSIGFRVVTSRVLGNSRFLKYLFLRFRCDSDMISIIIPDTIFLWFTIWMRVWYDFNTISIRFRCDFDTISIRLQPPPGLVLICVGYVVDMVSDLQSSCFPREAFPHNRTAIVARTVSKSWVIRKP